VGASVPEDGHQAVGFSHEAVRMFMRAKPKVAVLGAGGAMGLAMARNITRAGFPLCAWNSTREKADPLAREGASVVDSPAEAAEVAQTSAGTAIVVTVLRDADAVLEVMIGEDGFLHGPQQDGLIWVQMTSIGVPGTEHCAELAQRYGLMFVDAPVLGGMELARHGDLIVLASGPSGARDAVQPLLDVVGKETIWLGPAGAGSALAEAVPGPGEGNLAAMLIANATSVPNGSSGWSHSGY
jgi:3-hydroxyisobutyrate dehydrogenase